VTQGRDDIKGLGALLRAAADDELTPEQHAALEAHLRAHPEDEARIEFERALRERVGRTMGETTAPAALRERVERALEHESEAGPRPRRRRIAMGVLAMAASVVVVAGVLFALMSPGSPIGPDARYRSSLAGFLHSEHERCWVDADRILAKFGVRERDQLPASMATVFGHDVALPGEIAGQGSGLEFIAAGECNVPGRARSMHLGFRTDGTRGEAGVAVSLFIQPDETRLELEEGVTYRLTSERRIARGVCSIYAWTLDGMIYFLVSDDAGACDLALESTGAPTTISQL
jgi:ferric-dicitrate binding protein FerR (iron transport regulator)